MKKGNAITGIITTALCVLLAVGTVTFFSACGPKDDGGWMSCHWAERAVLAFAIVMTAMSVMANIIQKPATVFGIRLAMLPSAIITMFIPGVFINTCKMNDMQCNSVMRPAIILVAVCILVFTVINMIIAKKEDK